MLKSLHIKNFRCFKDFSLESLSKVNLITGQNNVGKTTLLEAMFMLSGVENAHNVLQISVFRGITQFGGKLQSLVDLLWTPLFHNFKSDRPIEISGLQNGGLYHVHISLVTPGSQLFAIPNSIKGTQEQETGGFAVQLNYMTIDPSKQEKHFKVSLDENKIAVTPTPSSPPFPGHLITPRHYTDLGEDTIKLGELITSKKKYDLARIIQKAIEPRLLSLTPLPKSGQPMIYGDIGFSRMLPIAMMGGGMNRLISILIRLAGTSGGVLFIDEIENGIHYSTMKSAWIAILDAAKEFDTQIIATTHSFECIRAARQACEETKFHDFFLHRLDWVNNTIQPATLDYDMLEIAIESGLETR